MGFPGEYNQQAAQSYSFTQRYFESPSIRNRAVNSVNTMMNKTVMVWNLDSWIILQDWKFFEGKTLVNPM